MNTDQIGIHLRLKNVTEQLPQVYDSIASPTLSFVHCGTANSVDEKRSFMKKQVVKMLTMVGLVNVLGMVVMVGAAHGQSLGDKIRINIPFDFTVGNNKLPAGEYSIGRAQPSSGDTILLISNLNKVANVLPITNAAQRVEPKHADTLVFHRYGDQYFLFQVWPAGATVGRVIPKSRSEREVARNVGYEVGAAVQKPKRVEVVKLY
jgi:hypothetical protein